MEGPQAKVVFMYPTGQRPLLGIQELSKILLSAGVLGLAFTIAARVSVAVYGFVTVLGFALLTVGVGFVGHELAHKFMAMRFGYWAAYQIWPTGLVLALALSLAGVIFAALGAVQIFGRGISRGEQGIISLSGPTFNIVLAVIFMGMAAAASGPYSSLLMVGAQLNALIALFNCLPFSILDGRKIFYWDRMVWLLAVAVAGVLLVIAVGFGF